MKYQGFIHATIIEAFGRELAKVEFDGENLR
jgi:hypothetical protein